MTAYISIDDVIEMNRRIVGAAAGIRDRTVLEGSLGRPTSGFGPVAAFPSLWSKAAVLLAGMASTQAFVDGNKRTAWAVCEAFLNLNGVDLGDIPTVEAEVFVLAVAASLIEPDAVALWLQTRAEQGAGRMNAAAPMGPRTTTPGRIEGGTVRLASLSESGAQIVGLTARGVTFLGPSVIIVAGGTRLAHCTWDTAAGGVEAIIWDVGPSRQTVVGAVALLGCDLKDCTFIGVGFAADADGVQHFLENVNVDGSSR